MSRALAAAEGQQPTDLLANFVGNLGMPAFIVTTLFPSLFGKVAKYPRAARILTIPLILWLASNFVVGKVLALWRKIMSNAMSSVTITSDDFYLYTVFKSWLSKQKMMMLEKAITAQSVFYLRNRGQDGRTIEKELSNNKSIVFDPQNKFQLFRHQGRFFLLTMDTKQLLHTATDRTEMKIWTLGLSPRPIESLLLEIYDLSQTTESRTLTTIMTPYGGRQWNRRCIKPARPISSVYLEMDEKNRLIDDMKEYLDPKTAKWYQDRGIPYRRGYLFHGSPGTGKSSLALALAGHFKLDVYIVSLLDLEISDSALLQLFQAVRSGVLVLLEDVDSAGLGREVEETPVSSTETSTLAKTNTTIAARKRAKIQTSRITLSGLLNAIDGAGAPEGHVLVMTTNTPDALDEALVRPGRIDVKLEFSKATKSQVKQIFTNMYRAVPTFDDKDTKGKDAEPIEKTEEELQAEKEIEEQRLRDEQELAKLAEQFAESVPEGHFSPAQLQDYILLRKDQPQRAAGEIGDWVAKELCSSAQTKDAKESKPKKNKKVKKAAVETEGAEKVEDVEQPKSLEATAQDTAEGTAATAEPKAPSTSSDSDRGSEKGSEEGETPASSIGSDDEVEAVSNELKAKVEKAVKEPETKATTVATK